MERDLDKLLATWDDPTKSQDTLGRTEFAKKVCKGLSQWQSDESLIVAVYGSWGSGKTWLLHRIASLLGDAGEVHVCNFSPWQIDSSDQILAEFFVTILKELKGDGSGRENSKKRAALWKKLAQSVTVAQLGILAATAFSGGTAIIPTALGAVGSLLKQGGEGAAEVSTALSISDLRDELTALFGDPDSPRILVTIDDLDRLEDEQIRMIIRLVKTTANFPNLNYLILGERKQLASALDHISSNEGDRYLEKIVQIPLTLPQARDSEIRGRLWEGLEMIAGECNYDLEARVERYEAFWREFLRSKLVNYRSVHRLLTTVSFHARCLTNEESLEVDLLDLLTIDFIRLFAPGMYGKIAASPLDGEWFMANRVFSLFGAEKEERENSKNALDLIESSELGADCAFQVLIHLHPSFFSLVPQFTKRRRHWSNDHQK